jgi:hypothetical protein
MPLSTILSPTIGFKIYCKILQHNSGSWYWNLHWLQDRKREENHKYTPSRDRNLDWLPGSKRERTDILIAHHIRRIGILPLASLLGWSQHGELVRDRVPESSPCRAVIGGVSLYSWAVTTVTRPIRGAWTEVHRWPNLVSGTDYPRPSQWQEDHYAIITTTGLLLRQANLDISAAFMLSSMSMPHYMHYLPL